MFCLVFGFRAFRQELVERYTKDEQACFTNTVIWFLLDPSCTTSVILYERRGKPSPSHDMGVLVCEAVNVLIERTPARDGPRGRVLELM